MNSTLLQKALFILYFGEGIGPKNRFFSQPTKKTALSPMDAEEGRETNSADAVLITAAGAEGQSGGLLPNLRFDAHHIFNPIRYNEMHPDTKG
jgi:hypothetical protein